MPQLHPNSHVPKVPSQGTLRRYGLDVRSWLAILESQGNVCAICKRVPPSGRWVIDHEHVKGWKKMTPSERKKYVRGVLCFLCNGKCVSKHVTLERAINTVAYFKQYNQRRPKDIEKKVRKK